MGASAATESVFYNGHLLNIFEHKASNDTGYNHFVTNSISVSCAYLLH